MSYSIMNFLGEYAFHILVGLFSASVAGSIGFIIWLLLMKRAAKFAIRHAMTFFQINLLSFAILIIIYVVVNKTKKAVIGCDTMGSTRPAVIGTLVIFAVWFVTLIKVLQYRYREYCKMRHLNVHNRPIEDRAIWEVAEKWKKKFGVKKRTWLFYNETISSPALVYNKGYRILLPTYEMTEDELNIALSHEVAHLMYRDITTKNIAFIINAVHSFNPLTYELRKQLMKWEEVRCDWFCCTHAEEYDRREYFTAIMNLKEKSRSKEEEKKQMNAMCSFTEDEELVDFRVDIMLLRKEEEAKKHILATVLMVIASIMIMAFSWWIVYKGLSFVTELSLNWVQERSTEDFAEEDRKYTTKEKLLKNADVSYWEENIVGAYEGTELELNAGEIVMFAIPELYGDVVYANLMVDGGKDCQIGCIGEAGSVVYREKVDMASLEFDLQDEKIEQFYIENIGPDSCRLELFLFGEE